MNKLFSRGYGVFDTILDVLLRLVLIAAIGGFAALLWWIVLGGC